VIHALISIVEEVFSQVFKMNETSKKEIVGEVFVLQYGNDSNLARLETKLRSLLVDFVKRNREKLVKKVNNVSHRNLLKFLSQRGIDATKKTARSSLKNSVIDALENEQGIQGKSDTMVKSIYFIRFSKYKLTLESRFSQFLIDSLRWLIL
jgi:hypothetical protein